MFKLIWLIFCVTEFALAGVIQTGQLKGHLVGGLGYGAASVSGSVTDTIQLTPHLPISIGFAAAPGSYDFPRYGTPVYYNLDDFYIQKLLNNIIVDKQVYPISGLQANPVANADTFQYLAPYGSYGGIICW